MASITSTLLPLLGMEMNMQTGNGEDLMTLEQEITELQRENARVESQMMRLKSDINAMETHLSHGERVSVLFMTYWITLNRPNNLFQKPNIFKISNSAQVNQKQYENLIIMRHFYPTM